MKKIVTTVVLIGCAAIAVQAGQKTTAQGNKKAQTGTTVLSTEATQNPPIANTAGYQGFTYTNAVASWYTPASQANTKAADAVLGPTTRKQKQKEQKIESRIEIIAYRAAQRKAQAEYELYAQNQAAKAQGVKNQGQTAQTNKTATTNVKPAKKKRGCWLTRWAERQSKEYSQHQRTESTSLSQSFALITKAE